MSKLHGSKPRLRSCSTVGEVSKLSTQGEEGENEKEGEGESKKGRRTRTALRNELDERPLDCLLSTTVR